MGKQPRITLTYKIGIEFGVESEKAIIYTSIFFRCYQDSIRN